MTESDPARTEDVYIFFLCGQLVTMAMMLPASSKHYENHLNGHFMYICGCIGINKKEDKKQFIKWEVNHY